MKPRFLAVLVLAMALSSVFGSPIALNASEPNCAESILVYREDFDDWVCVTRSGGGQICTLCDDEIDVIG